MFAHGFPPVAVRTSRVLVLGTMPGLTSLRERQYYGHAENSFWAIAAELHGFDPTLPYGDRMAALLDAGVALWDVLKSCNRKSSLDSDIDMATLVANDFSVFFSTHRQIRRVYFNGAQAEILYRQHVLPRLSNPDQLGYLRLPSTSPANAALSFDAKLKAWRAMIDGVIPA